ncbi:GNAT family N-acetyltransferase [Aquibacillus koreensis]|uniref:GNAT family N-acetyltransferase n=1 Tax=Aquibacillus koreensis TaxID=279446 RepID=A0A9X3WKW6_9BACI|nr:GNAT family N-acetyltransferase [Aquibacillus koreensis]MCT2537535.1 GNAT family N-acetyltransferase [Aquibacillus koreensis]MDC3418981.1 GNAT family N-acetyltransferase [Aquibacillus koreensis]
MEKQKLLDLFHQELRVEANVQGYIKEETDHVIRYMSELGERNFILSSNLNEHNAKQVINHEALYFKELNRELEWKVYSYDQPENIKELLQDEGFILEVPEALMVLDIKQYNLTSSNDVIVTEITDKQGIDDIVALEDKIWNDSHSELGERLWRDKQNNPNSIFLYGIYKDEQLVSAAWMYLERNASFASLWGGSTLPEYRRKGYYQALIQARAAKALEYGYPFLTVDASKMSKPILENNGFICLTYSYPCVLTAKRS